MEFASRLQNFFELLRKDVTQIQAILKKDDRYLEEHHAMRDYHDLMDREADISREISGLSQRTMNLAGDEKISLLFSKLNEARGRLSEVASRKVFLRMKVFHEFKEFLPLLFEKYGKLEEMAKIQDLFEFNSIFKNTYPEIFRWQNRFRDNRRTREDARKKLNHDLQKITRLNTEISKKLGTMMRDLNQNFQTLLGEQNKKRMEMMAGKQNKMSKNAQELSDQFTKMNRKNPMITPRLANKMAATGKYMERAEKNLNNHQVAKSIDAENKSLAELEETRKLLQQMKNQDADETGTGKKKKLIRLGMGKSRDNQRGGSARMKKDKVDLPTEDQYQAPGLFREDILKAMKNKYPKQYERLVMEYYKELVK